MKILLGHNGLVGSTLKKTTTFDYYYNSKNISEFHKNTQDGDDIILCCLPATKWLVNKNLQQDIDNIFNIIKTIKTYNYQNIILISTIDIYCDSPLGSDETYKPNIGKLSYGNNRYLFELLIQEYIKTDNFKIFRLPALFNNLIKKNMIYDLIYNNNIDQINQNSFYQWYNLDNLYRDISYYSNQYPKETTFNLFTEPINTLDIINLFPEHKGKTQIGDLVSYDYRTKFGDYIEAGPIVFEEIKNFCINKNDTYRR
jgi:hypothetical protein